MENQQTVRSKQSELYDKEFNNSQPKEETEEELKENLLESFKSAKFKSIKTRLEFYLIGAFTVFTTIVCVFGALAVYDSTILTLENTLKISANESSYNFAKQFEVFEICMKEIAEYSLFDNVTANKAEIINLLESKSAEYWCYVSFIDLEGKDIRTGEYLANTDYFLGAYGGGLFIDEATTINGVNVMPVAYPAFHQGEKIGVMYLTPDVEYLNYLLNSIPISESNNKFIINSKGDYILSDNPGQFIGNAYNPLKDSSLKSSNKVMINKAIAGEIGFHQFQDTENEWLLATYAPIANTDGWIMVSTAYSLDFLDRLVFVVLLAVSLCLIISSIIVFKVRKSISAFVEPIDICIERVSKLALGNVKDPVTIFETGDEVEELSRCLNRIVLCLSLLVEDESNLLDQMANGNFSVKSKYPHIYIGDFSPLLVSINKILDDMNGTLSQISTASIEVTFGSENVASSAQSLAMGAHTQEQSSEALMQSFEQISSGIVVSSQKALYAQELTAKTGKEVKVGNAHMADLRGAMSDIYNSSQQISNIINSIKDIAFQTNILSLNASVEAARAGESGVGFAVVADEVRTLAIRSSDSAKNTEKLITATLEAVERGSQITNATANSLEVIVECVEEAIVAINDIAGTMTDQTTEVKVVIRSLEEISQVINNTSFTSQESAAISEELSAQAQALSDLVLKFQLNK